MKQEFKWAEALRISPQQLMEWQDIAPEGVPLLFWCVQEGHVTSSQYLEWAIDYFQLPVLQDEFFEEYPKLEKRPPGDWQPWFCPVAEWDGVLYVACVEPPPSPLKPKAAVNPVKYLLASPVALTKAWGTKTKENLKVEAPVPEQPDKTYVIEIPDGLTATNVKKKSFLQMDDNPTGVTKLTNSSIDLELTNSKSASRVQTQIAHKPETPAGKKSAILDLKPPIKPAVPAPAIPPLPKAPAAQVKPAAPLKVGKSKLPPAPASLDDAESPEHAFSWAFAEVSEHYTHIMALQEVSNVMNPLFWTPNWKAPKETHSRATALDQPSLFRIAGKTRRPYHGFVVESEIHKEFFTAWGFESLPSCATAIPVVVRDHVWGIILCVGEESAQSPEALRCAEETGEKIAQYLTAQIAAA